MSNLALSHVGATTSRADLVAESIRGAILDRTLKPGDVLVERQLAEQLGVSKTPVREGLIALARTGLLTINRGRGATVRDLSYMEIRHVYEERALIEPWALRRVIESGRREFTEARAALTEAEEHAKRGDQAARALANRRFHRGLYANCENSLVVHALDALQDLVALAVVTVFWAEWSSGDVESNEHEAILTAAQDGDAALAESLLSAHIEKSITHALTRENSIAREAEGAKV
jgi:DNA-binding GntR family transcriptional regulator